MSSLGSGNLGNPGNISRPSGLMVASRKLRPPLKTFGGKFYLARRIISLMPPHQTYVEPYLGGGSVLLNKVRSEIEVASDIDPNLMNFWTVLADPTDDFLGFHLPHIAYSQGSFDESLVYWNEHQDARIRALWFLVRNRFSRGGLGKAFAWSDRQRGGQPGDLNAWETIQKELPAIRSRVRWVDFRCCNGVDLIRLHDSRSTLIYCDPPYLHETRTAKSVYDYEMTKEQHEELLSTILCCRATVMISGYRSDLYDEALSSWTRHEFSMPNHSGQGRTKNRRIECLWINRPAGGT